MFRPSLRRVQSLLDGYCPLCEGRLYSQAKYRTFSQSSRLLLLSASSSRARPQLPFLHSSRLIRRTTFPQQLARLLTTETTQYFKDSFWSAIKLTVYVWAGIYLAFIAKLGYDHEQLEQRFPTPPQWSWLTRWRLRAAKAAQHPSQLAGAVIPDWAEAAGQYKLALERLENPHVDGQGFRPALGEDGVVMVDQLGKIGADISGQSEPWRRGYYQVLLGAAMAAEHVEGWVKDTTRNMVFPREVMLGPSNPKPKPVPHGSPEAPKEESCHLYYASPEVYYMKIMTTTGFSNTQKVQAALAYADWLDFKNLPNSAEDVLTWAMDISTQAYSPPSKAPIDRKTGILDPRGPVTANLMDTVTALAAHHAKAGNLSTSLPMFLSLLRARRSLLSSDEPNLATMRLHKSVLPDEDPMTKSWLDFIIKDRPYPEAPQSGDEVCFRKATSPCTEAAILANVGEVLFASPGSTTVSSLLPRVPASNDVLEVSPSQTAGLVWTREAVELAEASLRQLIDDGSNCDQPSLAHTLEVFASGKRGNASELGDTLRQCADCLKMATSNWTLMVNMLADKEKDEILRRTLEIQELDGLASTRSRADRRDAHLWWAPRQNITQDISIDTRNQHLSVDEPSKWAGEAKLTRERARGIRRYLREQKLE